jgi:hypothetical protein
MMDVQVGRLLEEFASERISWRSFGRLARGKITVLDGDPGLGKSTLLTDWAARMSRGDALPDGDPHPERGIVLLSAEDDPGDTIRPRFEAAGGDVSRLLLLNEIPKRDENDAPVFDAYGEPVMSWFGFPDDCRLLRQAVEAMNAGLVIIDPLMAYLSPDVRANSDQDIRRALSPLSIVAQETGVSVVIVRHLNKSGGVNALYRGGGSIGIIGLARIGLLLGKSKKNPNIRVLASVKNNISKPAPSLGFELTPVQGSDVALMQYIGEVPETANDLLLGDVTSDEEQDEHDEAEEWLREYLSHGQRESSQVMKDARSKQLSERSIRRAKTKLKVVAKPGAFQGAWTWELPRVHPVATNGHHHPVLSSEEAF